MESLKQVTSHELRSLYTSSQIHGDYHREGIFPTHSDENGLRQSPNSAVAKSVQTLKSTTTPPKAANSQRPENGTSCTNHSSFLPDLEVVVPTALSDGVSKTSCAIDF